MVSPARLCVHHPARPAFAVCMTCRKPICQECATQWDGIYHCTTCLAARRGATVRRSRADDGVGRRADRGTVLIRAPLSTTSVLDEMSDAVALAAVPWAGVLVLTSLPYYFLQVLFLERLAEVGNAASHYGRALGALANWTLLAFVVSLWG